MFMLVKDEINFYAQFKRAIELIAQHTQTAADINRLIDRIADLEKPVQTTEEYKAWLNRELDGIEADLTAAARSVQSPPQSPTRPPPPPTTTTNNNNNNNNDNKNNKNKRRKRARLTSSERFDLMDSSDGLDSLLEGEPYSSSGLAALVAAADTALTAATTSADEPAVTTSPATATSPTSSTEGQLGPSGNSTTRVAFGAAVTSPKLTKRRKSAAALARAAALSAVTSTPAPPAPTARTPVTPVTAPPAPAPAAAAHTPVTSVTASPALVASPVAARASLKRTAAAAVPVEASSASSKRVRIVRESDDEGDEGEVPDRAPVRAPMTAAEVAAREDQQYVARATSQGHAAVFEDFLFLHGLHRESQKPKYRLTRRNEPKEDLDKAQPKAPPVPTDPAIFTDHFVLFPPTNCKREVMRERKVPELYVSLYLQRAGTKAWRYFFTHSARSDSSPTMCMQLEANPDHMACMVWGGVNELSTSSRADKRYRVLQLAQIIDFLVLAKPYRAEEGRGSLPSFDGIGRLQFSQSDTQLEPFLVDVVNAQVEIAVFDKAADGWCIKVSVANARRLYERYRVMCTEGKKSEYIVCICVLIILCIYYYMQET